MGLKKWIADKYLKITEFSGKITENVGEIAGDIVQGTGYVIADISGAIGLEGTADFVRETTKTAGKNISGAAKVVSGTNTALARAIVDTTGEILGDEDLSLVAWDHEQEIDVLEEIEKIHESNVALIDNYSGAKEFEALKKVYHEKYREITGKYKGIVNNTFENISTYVDTINAQREQAAVNFMEFEEVSKLIAEWSIDKYHFKEIPRLQMKVPDKSKDSTIFLEVNYDEHPIWMRLKGIFTKGNQNALTEAEGKIKASLQEIEDKCRIETMRWTKVSENLNQVQGVFVEFNEYYIRVIEELRYAIGLVKCAMVQKDIFLFEENYKINPYFLPEKHLHCLMACDRLSRLLCEMSKRTYLDSQSVILENDVKCIQEDREAINHLKKIA